MIPLFNQILYIFSWIFVLLLLKNSFRILFETYLPVEFSRPISYGLPIFIFGYISWFLVVLQIPFHYIWIIVIGAFIYCIFHHISLVSILKEDLLWDSGLLLFFSMFLMGYSVNPDIFLNWDRAFSTMNVASILRTPSVPPPDPIFFGGYLDIYYYFIFWVFAGMGYITNTPVSCVNGLAVSVILSLSAIILCSMGKIIIPKLSFLPLIILIVPRPSFFYILFTVPGLNSILSICERSALAIVPGCDYDYQLTGTLYGNIHPMMAATALRLLLIFLLLIIVTKWDNVVLRIKQILLGLLSVASGLLFITYAWDIMIFLPLLILLFSYLIYDAFRRNYSSEKKNQNVKPDPCLTEILNLAYPTIPGILLVSIWFSKVHNAGVTGLVLNHQSQLSFMGMLLVNGWFICILFLHCFQEITKKPIYLFFGIIPVILGYVSLSLFLVPALYLAIKKGKAWYDYLTIWAIICLSFSELFTVVTGIGIDRFNTTLKINYIIWPVIWVSIFGICNSWLMKFYHESPIRYVKTCQTILGLIFVFVIIISPALSYGGTTRPSIDGASRIEVSRPDLPNIIQLLSNDSHITSLVEGATGYGLSEITVLSGIPNFLQAWMVEEIWGRDKEEVYGRYHIIKEIYTNNSFYIDQIIKSNISYIIVDNNTVDVYGKVSMNTSSLQEVYSGAATTIYKV